MSTNKKIFTIYVKIRDEDQLLWNCHFLASMLGHPMCPRRFVNPFLLLSIAIKRQTAAWGWYETCTPVLGDGGMASRPTQLCSRDHSTSSSVPFVSCVPPGPGLPPPTLQHVSLVLHMINMFPSAWQLAQLWDTLGGLSSLPSSYLSSCPLSPALCWVPLHWL